MTRGIDILEETAGLGEVIERYRVYRMSFKIWLNKGDAITWTRSFGLSDRSIISEDGCMLTTDCRIDRECLIGGLFYGIEGMRIGGRRLLKIAPHLAYRERGVEGMIPPNAVLKVEVCIHEEREMNRHAG